MKQMGYLMVDHRASPGLPEDIARWAGYDPKQTGEGKVYEVDTLKCFNCHGHVVPNPFRTRERHSYKGHYVCDHCAYLLSRPDYVHTPLSKIFDNLKTQAMLGSSPRLLTSQ